eukprot:gene3481-6130_t
MKKTEVKKLFDKKLIRAPLTVDELLQREDDLKLFREFIKKFKSEIYIDLKILIKDNETTKEKNEFMEKINVMIQEEKLILDKKKIEEIKETIETKHNDSLIQILNEYTNSSLNYLFFRFRSNKEWKSFVERKYEIKSKTIFEDKYKITSKIKKIKASIYHCSILEIKKKLEYFCQIKSLKEDEAEKYFEKVVNLRNKIKEPYENVVELNDIFKEKSNLEEGKIDIILVLTNVKINFKDFIEENRSMNIIFKHYELVLIMNQLISSLKSLHEQEYFFPIYELNENRIFFNQTCSVIYLDPGFLEFDENQKSKIQIWNEVGEINHEKVDLHALGIIFFHLCTLKNMNEIEEIFTHDELISSNIQSSSSSSIMNSISEEIFIPKYQEEIIKEIYNLTNVDKRISKIIFEMLLFEKQSIESLKKISIEFEKLLFEIESNEEKSLKKIAKNHKSQLEEEKRIEEIENEFHLINFIKRKKYRELFRNQLKKEFCEESLLFIDKVDEFQSTKQKEISNEIIKVFIQLDSNYTLNISDSIKNLLILEYNELENEEIPIDFFDPIVNEILNGTLNDAFIRYSDDPEFKKLKRDALTAPKRRTRSFDLKNVFSGFTEKLVGLTSPSSSPRNSTIKKTPRSPKSPKLQKNEK